MSSALTLLLLNVVTFVNSVEVVYGYFVEATLARYTRKQNVLLMCFPQECEATDSTADAHTYRNTKGTDSCYSESQSTASSITLPNICHWL